LEVLLSAALAGEMQVAGSRGLHMPVRGAWPGAEGSLAQPHVTLGSLSLLPPPQPFAGHCFIPLLLLLPKGSIEGEPQTLSLSLLSAVLQEVLAIMVAMSNQWEKGKNK